MQHDLVIVGTGGSGGWFCQLLAKSSNPNREVTLIDGDKWSKSNLSRQFCTLRDINKPKVNTFMKLLEGKCADVLAIDSYFAYGNDTYKAMFRAMVKPLCIFAAVDNHPARMACYALADAIHDERPEQDVCVISVANEYEAASAWAYLPQWKDHATLDPRMRWPEMQTDVSGDPLRPSCTGEALESAPQLALSNMLSASAGAWLHRFWTEVRPKLEASMQEGGMQAEDLDKLRKTYPVLVDFTSGRNKTYTVGDYI